MIRLVDRHGKVALVDPKKILAVYEIGDGDGVEIMFDKKTLAIACEPHRVFAAISDALAGYAEP